MGDRSDSSADGFPYLADARTPQGAVESGDAFDAASVAVEEVGGRRYVSATAFAQAVAEVTRLRAAVLSEQRHTRLEAEHATQFAAQVHRLQVELSMQHNNTQQLHAAHSSLVRTVEQLRRELELQRIARGTPTVAAAPAVPAPGLGPFPAAVIPGPFPGAGHSHSVRDAAADSFAAGMSNLSAWAAAAAAPSSVHVARAAPFGYGSDPSVSVAASRLALSQY